ncbi:phosphoribosylanthranilate isomerase [Verrucomicrobiaceae bacterium R5-34]|nr:phosphoribosylanthranilate isomerase [Verrucomicrobiaceae bacterium R5-34]
MNAFFDPTTTSLKICGVTRMEDVSALIDLGVDALGVNFWPHSKRYLAPDSASPLLQHAAGKILRVGVFVNADPELPRSLLAANQIDVAQFHGDESADYCAAFASENLPFIKAIGVKNKDSLANISDYNATAILLDTPAPGVYGGTGETFDWTHAQAFIAQHPEIPVLLAGGITPVNAADAIDQVHPCALDIASGAELSPGIKALDKVQALLAATQR